MKKWTLGQIRNKIKSENDLQDENFIRPTELDDLIREAIEEAEAEIHTLYEDYFLTSSEIAVSTGDELVDLPDDIYANKIRRILFKTSNQVYTVTRLKDWKKFEAKADNELSKGSAEYRYFVVNNSGSQSQMNIVPTMHESGKLIVWYLRSAKILTLESDVCDIPFVPFIFAHVKVKVMEKEKNDLLPQAMEKLEQKRQQLNASLSNMIVDMDNEIEADFTNYEGMN